MTYWTLPLTLPALTTSSIVIPTPVPTYRALIAGAFVEIEQGTVNIQNQIGQRSQGAVTVKTPLGTLWQYGTQALIFDASGAQVYGGYVAHDRAYRDNGVRQADLGWLYHDLTLMDNCYRADKRVVQKVYANVSAGFIVNDLLGSYLADEGVISIPGSIATGATIIQAIWNLNKSVADALSWLAQESGFWWNIDQDGVLWFQPYGGISAPFAIDGTNLDSMQQVSVEGGNDLLVNKQYVKGSVAQTATLTETFKGDGVSRSFTLSFPLNTLNSLTLNAVDITADVTNKGSTSGSYHMLVGDAVIAQDPSQTILTSSDTLVCSYIGQYPVLTAAQNPAQIAAQAARERTGSGIIESVYSDTKVRNLPAAFAIASNQLTHYGADLVIFTGSTRATGLAPGQLINVSLTDYGLTNLPMLISGVTITDQVDGINIWFSITAIGAVGATSWALEAAQYQTLWQRIMAQTSDPSDYTDATDTAQATLLTSVVSTTPTITITETTSVGPICGDTMMCGEWTVA